jgi:hypothetical protein
MGTGRIWILGLLAAGVWLLSVYGSASPIPLPANAPPAQFSAARADATLAYLLGDERPRPSGSPQAAVFRARLQQQLDALGVPNDVITQESCYVRRGERRCLTVSNIRAVVVPGASVDNPETLLMAHTDSVPRGPGAADDASGVATILETIRALKARGLEGSRPLAALFTDGEERGLFGAFAYTAQADNIARTGMVVNVEARGTSGPSLLFQSHAGDRPLIDLYATAASHPAASSLYAEIYRILPNNTDLTPFLMAGVPGANFAFIGNLRQYHSADDRRENISPVTLQHHGDNVLALTSQLIRTDPATLDGEKAIYLDILRRWLPRLPASFALPLSIAVFFAIALAGWASPRERGVQRPVAAVFAPLLLLLLCVAAGFVLYAPMWIGGTPTLNVSSPVLQAVLVSAGPGGPWPGNPLWLRLALAFGAWAAALWTARFAGPIVCWLWFAGLAVVTSIWLPGLSPYFLFPALVAAPLLLLTRRGGRSFALFLSALAGMVIWLGFTVGAEDIQGLRLHPIFMLTTAFALLSLLPLMAGRKLGGSAVLSLGLALVFAVIAGFDAV